MAHDFNNLLSVIIGSASFLDELLVKHKIETEDVRLIQEAAPRGASLTNDLLAFSRRRVVQPVPTDVRTLVFEAERMVRRVVGESIQVATNVATQPLTVVIDPSQLSQVLVNLAINARDAMPDGGTLTIEATPIHVGPVDGTDRLDLSLGAHARITVSDNGIGVTPEVVAQAFEPFFTTKPVGRGSGPTMLSRSVVLPSGTILSDRYRVERKLGEGGMGVVYGRGHVVVEERMFGDERESQSMERRQKQISQSPAI